MSRRDDVLELLAQGMAQSDIARALEMYPQSVSKIVRNAGLSTPRTVNTDATREQCEAAARRIERGESLAALAAEYGVNSKTLYWRLRRFGLPTTAPKQPKPPKPKQPKAAERVTTPAPVRVAVPEPVRTRQGDRDRLRVMVRVEVRPYREVRE